MAVDKLQYSIGNSASTTLSSSISNVDTTAPLTADTNFAAKSGEGMVLLDEGQATEELAYSTTKTGSTLTIPLVNRGLEGGSAQAHTSTSSVKGIFTAGMWNNVIDALVNLVSKSTGAVDSTKIVPATYLDTDGTLTANSDSKIATQKATKTYVDSSGIMTTSHYAPQGFLVNGKIVPSVGSNNLTVAIKGLDGNDPSGSNPVYCRIGDTVRTITAALSVTKNAGTNWFAAGSAELATQEIEYFVYLGYNATDGVVVGFSRIPFASQYDDFSSTTTNEKYCAISTISNAAAGDDYELIGRFAATLSAGAGYTWTVPTFTTINLVQRPIYESRILTYQPAYTGWSNATGTAVYQIIGRDVHVPQVTPTGTSNAATAKMTLPFTVASGVITDLRNCYVVDSGTGATSPGRVYIAASTNAVTWGKVVNSDDGFTSSGTKTVYGPYWIYKV
jgi:hypothetical protein